MIKQIPNLFTLLNLIFGCIAIIFILQTGETLVTQDAEGSWVPQLPERIWWGAVMIGLAAVVDFLDGFVARLFKATSAMGAQLDSLADVVSFGVAPGLILYQLLRISFISEPDGIDTSVWMLAPALIFPAAAAWRLARFNTEAGSNEDFSGLPSPMAGLVAASFPLIVFFNDYSISSVIVNKWFIYAAIILLGFLMVSRVSFVSMKFTGTGIKENLPKIILAIIAIIAAVIFHWLAVPIVFIAYFIVSLTTKKQTK